MPRPTVLLSLLLLAALFLPAAICVPALAQDEVSGDAQTDAAVPAEEAEGDEIWERYQPPVPLETTNEGSRYELYRQPDGELAVTVFMPHWTDMDERENFPALDLMGYIGHISRQDPGFETLALELGSWQWPSDASDTASIQLAMVHGNCSDPEVEGMPEMTIMGDATALMGDVYEVIILHPLNIPIAGAMVEPVENGDSFGITMLMAGSLSARDYLTLDPQADSADSEDGEEHPNDYFNILPEYQPPVRLDTLSAVDVYEVIRQLDGESVATLIVPDWDSIDDHQGLPALDLSQFVQYACQQDQSYVDMRDALLWREPPARMANLASWQLMIIHANCSYPEYEEYMPALERYGYSTFFFGDELNCVIVHPRNIPIAGALVYSGQGNSDFINLLTIIGELTCLYE